VIIPSIDLQDGQTVQLVGGEDKALDAGDPIPIAEKFRLVGEIAVIDLDAAMGKGNNRELIEKLVKIAPCRVGGGIRDAQTAMRWLDAGATKVILGTAATPEILSQLPGDRVIAALDARHGEVVVEGWQKGTGRGIRERMDELRHFVGGFMVTFVEREGRLQGIDLKQVEDLVNYSAGTELTVAGGVTTPEDVAAIDKLGARSQVGMALYTGKFDLGDALSAMLKSDRSDGLWPTIVVDEYDVALGLTYSNRESLKEALNSRRGVYHSRARGLWKKGETSGATQELLRVDLDCDRDTLRFVVRQEGLGFCHLKTWTCFGQKKGLTELSRRLAERTKMAPDGSYTRRLLSDPELLRAKLIEEAKELASAQLPDDVAHEAADVIYFALVAMARAGVPLSEVEKELDRRALRVSRRPGNAKG
jgi:phosphoribosyl-AMP cyclohydrolase / phosphoribosyl-ATP pyrophosphohydrolase